MSKAMKDAASLDALLAKWEGLSEELYQGALKDDALGFKEEGRRRRSIAYQYKERARDLREAIGYE